MSTRLGGGAFLGHDASAAFKAACCACCCCSCWLEPRHSGGTTMSVMHWVLMGSHSRTALQVLYSCVRSTGPSSFHMISMMLEGRSEKEVVASRVLLSLLVHPLP